MNITGLRHSVARVELAQRAGVERQQLPGVEQAAGDAPGGGVSGARGASTVVAVMIRPEGLSW